MDVEPGTPARAMASGAIEAEEEKQEARIAARAASSATPGPAPSPRPTAANRAKPSASPSPLATAEVRTIGSISGGDLGVKLTIARVGIVDTIYFSKGVKYTLSDGTGTITLVVWQNVMEEIPERYGLVPGSQVRVTGEIDEYEGDLEIIPRAGNEVKVLARADRPPLEERLVRDITPADEGRIFSVTGRVLRAEERRWLKIWLSDGTGEIQIFAPERIVEYLPAGIQSGASLRVTGEVDIYQGAMEIIPLAGADVELR